MQYLRHKSEERGPLLFQSYFQVSRCTGSLITGFWFVSQALDIAPQPLLLM